MMLFIKNEYNINANKIKKTILIKYLLNSTFVHIKIKK